MLKERTDYIFSHSIQEVDLPQEEPESKSELKDWKILWISSQIQNVDMVKMT